MLYGLLCLYIGVKMEIIIAFDRYGYMRFSVAFVVGPLWGKFNAVYMGKIAILAINGYGWGLRGYFDLNGCQN
jgi:hypothetical protein